MSASPRTDTGAAAPRSADPRAAAPRSADQVLRRLEWTVVRRLDGMLHGDYRTLFRGFGLDLADLREYQLHDDVRHIDWNVTARLQTPYVREYYEDREVTAWFLLDLSSSLDFGSLEVRKRGLLTDFVTVLARLLTRHGNKVGVILYSGQDAQGAGTPGLVIPAQVIPPRGGRQHVLHILQSLMQRPETSGRHKTDLGGFLRSAFHILQRRSLVFVVSDFISEPGWAEPLALLGQRHEMVAVRLYDPMELELPDLGMIVMQDAETGEQLVVDTHDRGFRRRFVAKAAKREEEIRLALRRAGVDALELATDDDLFDSLMRFTDLRRQRSRLVGGGVGASVGPGLARGGGIPDHLEANEASVGKRGPALEVVK